YVLAAEASNSNTTVAQLGEAFQQVGTTAGTLGYSIEDVSVALGLMANSGIKASTAGTGLATALTRMSGANETATAEMDELGISMFNADGSTKELSEFLVELRSSLNENCSSASDLTVATYKLAGQKGMKALQAIVNASDEDFQSLTDSINESNGAAQEMADTKLDNYAGQVTLLNSAFDALKVEVGEQLTPALGLLAEGATTILNWITDLIQKVPVLVPILAGLTTGVGALTVGLIAAKVAAAAFGKELNAIPILAIVSGVIALTTAIVTLVAKWKQNKEAQMENTNAAKDLESANEDLLQSYQDAQDELDSSSSSISALVDQYARLSSKADLTAGEQAILKETTAQLVDAVPALSSAYDEETGTLDKTIANVQALAAEQENQAQYASDVEQLTAIEQQYNAILEEQTSDKERLEEVQAALNDSTLQLTDTETGEVMTKQQLKQEEKDLTSAISELDDAQGELQGTYDELNERVNEYAEAQEEVVEETNPQITTSVENLGSELIALQQNYQDVYDSALDSMKGQFDLWEQADDVVTTSFEDMMDALTSQQKYWEDYSDNLDNLKNRNIDGLDELLEAYGDDAAAVASMAALDNDQLQSMADQWKTTTGAMEAADKEYTDVVTNYSDDVNTAMQQCIDQLNNMDLSDEMKQEAYNTLQGYVEGLDEESDDVDGEILQVAQESLDAFKDMLGINSPSKVYEELGTNTLEGYENGVDDEQKSSEQTMADSAQKMKDAFEKLSNSTTLTQAGKDTMTGYESGVTAKQSEAMAKMQEAAQKALNSYTNLANSNSLTSSGTNTIQGFISGVAGKAADSANKMLDVARNAVSTFQNNATSSSLTNTGSSTLNGFITGLANTSASVANKMIDVAQNAVNKFKSNATSSSLTSAGSNTLQGFINGLNNTASTLYSKMQSIASSALSKFKKTLGIASPSTEAEEAAGFFNQGFVNGLSNTAKTVDSAMEDMADGVIEIITPTAAMVETMFSNLKTGDVSIDSMQDGLSSAFAGMAEDAGSWGEQICKKLAEGIEDNSGLVTAQIGGLSQALAGSGIAGASDSYMSRMSAAMAGSMASLDASGMAVGSATSSASNTTNNATTTNMGGISININGYNYSDDNALAQTIADKINEMFLREQAVYR
ncbi:MAG: phage tail tape measure protein, partial [Clostridia bacterium]|nr:phage tail tape measure protein [Clostridia bacterium]